MQWAYIFWLPFINVMWVLQIDNILKVLKRVFNSWKSPFLFSVKCKVSVRLEQNNTFKGQDINL